MKKSSIILVVIAVLLLGTAVWAYSNWRAYAPETYVKEEAEEDGMTKAETVNTVTGTSVPGAPTFTMAEVAAHKDATSCYAVIRGKVYDLTLWVNIHPGGKAPILSLCGTDGTAKFIGKHGTAEKPNAALSRFLIGTLVQ